jgi:hypothetical protein
MVAADWTALGQTTVGAAAAIVGGLLGSWMQGRSQGQLERHRRRERFAEVMADTTSLLWEMDPHRPHFGHRLRDASSFFSANDRRMKSVRARLLLLVVGHSDAQVRDLARQLDQALYELDSAMGIFVDSMELEQSTAAVAKQRAEAKERHGEADRLLSDLLKAI